MPAGGSRSSAALLHCSQPRLPLPRLRLNVSGTVQACDKGLVLLSDTWSLAYGSPRRSPIGSMGRVAVHLAVPPRAALQDGPGHPALASAFSRFSAGLLPWLPHMGNQGSSSLAMACSWVSIGTVCVASSGRTEHIGFQPAAPCHVSTHRFVFPGLPFCTCGLQTPGCTSDNARCVPIIKLQQPPDSINLIFISPNYRH